MGAVASGGQQTGLVKFLPLAQLNVPVGTQGLGSGRNANSVWPTRLFCAACHLRSLRRVEMVVRRKPLSRLDSAVAIWYSSFSMEKGLAIRRHLRS